MDHVEDEKILSNALLSVVNGVVDNNGGDIEGDVTASSEPIPVLEDSEF
jgi:hypothetical protein